MNVLLLNTSEHTGGAAIATLRLCRALRSEGIAAQMMVRDGGEGAGEAVAASGRLQAKYHFLAERASIFLQNGLRRDTLFAIDTASHGADITHHPAFRKADIVHLGWVNQGMLSLSGLHSILRTGKPVVWTLHDMWTFTGICHYAEACEGWLKACGHCPLLRFPRAHDLSARTFLRKSKAYKEGRMTIVCCSDWLAELARRAPLLQGLRIESIPNAIDTDFFCPASQTDARRQLGLPTEGKLLLFIAHKTTDERKGVRFLVEASQAIAAARKDVAIVVCGLESNLLKDAFACPAYVFDFSTDRERLRRLYRAADLLMMPTLGDNLPNTIVEGMACALPCVGFRVGGLPQMVQDGVNGQLVPLRNSTELARATLGLLNEEQHAARRTAARETAVANYSQQAVAQRYIAVYNDMLA